MKLTEKELIGKLYELRQITPQNNWVNFTKTQILGEEPKFTLFPYLKPAFAGFIAVFVLFIGLYGTVKNSIPGDLLYSLRRIAHEGQAVFVPESEKTAFQLKLANDRLEDMAKAPAKNLAPTISEFKANISEAAKNLAKIDATTSDPVVIKKIVEETKKLEENKQKVESLGVVIDGTEQLDNALKQIVDNLVLDLEGRTLNENTQTILAGMKELANEGKYSDALELYLTNQ